MQLVGKENSNSNTTYEKSRVSMGSFLFPFIIQTQGARHVVDTVLPLILVIHSEFIHSSQEKALAIDTKLP